MKKIKFVTSLSCIATLSSVTPVVVNCSLTNKPLNPVIPGRTDIETTCPLKVISGTGGSISINGERPKITYEGKFEIGDSVRISAIPTDYFDFESWSDGDTNWDRHIIITSDIELVANFVRQEQTEPVDAVNSIKFNGMWYELSPNVDPNLFIGINSSDSTENIHYIPLKEQNCYILVGKEHGSWDLVESLKLKSTFCKSCKIGNDFLYGLKNLKKADLSGIRYINSIGDHFLANCPNLKELKLPLEIPANVSVDTNYFMSGLSEDCTINCGPYESLYRNAYPWNTRINQMFGVCGQYSIRDIGWVRKNDYTATADLKLFDDGVELLTPLPIIWKIEDATAKCLNATINGSTVSVAPTKEATGNNKLVIGAYLYGYLDKQLAEKTIEVSREDWENSMVYDGKKYILSEYIDPNRFQTGSPWDLFNRFFVQHIWTNVEGEYVTIDGTREAWAKLTSVKLRVVDSSIRSLKQYFLRACYGLKEVDLSGLTNIKDIGCLFLDNAYFLDSLTLPQRSPSWADDVYFMLDLNPSCIIHCGNYLHEYQTTYPWSLRATQMVY